MHIVLKCRASTGAVSFPATTLNGWTAPARLYQIVDSTVVLSGYPDAILHQDADDLLKMPNGLYRMPTPAEQSEMVQASQAAVSVQESMPESGSQPLALLEKIKKAVGG